MYKRFLPILIVLMAGLGWSISASAQENDGAAELIMITAKSGQGQALEDAIKQYHHWIADKEGHWEYQWYMIETGPNSGKYVARSGDHNWAEFDEEFDWEDEANEAFLANVAPLIESYERMLTEEMEDFAYWPEDFSGYTLFQVEHWYVKNGQYGKFRQGLETVHAALTEADFGQHYGFQSTVSGGKGNEVTLVLPMQGYAGFADEDPDFFDIVSEALGGPEAFAAFMADWGSTFKAGENYLVRYLPEASSYGDDE